MSVCRSCGRSIRWAITINGDPIPLDAEPSEHGTIRLEPTAPGAETQLAVYVRDLDRPNYAGQLYLAHKEDRPRLKHRPEPDPGLRYWGD
jgi:hypothetical protein